MSPLEEASLDDLVREIESRVDCCVITSQKRGPNGKGTMKFIKFHGDPITCLGLIVMARRDVEDLIDDATGDVPPDVET